MPDGVKLAIVEDHELMLDALVTALGSDDRFDVVATAGSVADYRALVDELDVDVVVTDLALPDGTAADVAALTRETVGVPVLLITGQGDIDGVTAAIEGGCAGFVSKGAPLQTLAAAIDTIAAGGSVFPADVLRQVIRVPPASGVGQLTERELAVLENLAAGRNAGEIADELVLSIHTVRNHIRSILTKLDARSQLEAVVVGVRTGLVRIT